MPEKLLDALLRGYMVKLGSTPALPAGPAGTDRGRTSYAVWDRARHGNHPALTLDSQGEVLWYQEAPPDLLWQLLFIGAGARQPGAGLVGGRNTREAQGETGGREKWRQGNSTRRN